MTLHRSVSTSVCMKQLCTLVVCWMSYMPLTHTSFHVPHYCLLLSLALMLSARFEMSFSRTASGNSEAFTRTSSASSASSIKRSTSASGWNLSPEEEAIFERMNAMKIDAAKVTEGCCKSFVHVMKACLILHICLWISRCRPKRVLRCLVYAYLIITPVIDMYNYIILRQIYTVNTQVIEHSKATRKTLGSGLKEHFKFLLTMGPTELDKEV